MTDATLPRISIVVEAAGADDTAWNDFTIDRCLWDLAQQRYPLDKMELLICAYEWTDEQSNDILQRYPHAQIVDSPDGAYYRTKNAGIRRATGEVIALADADCSYSSDWLASIAASFQEGADVSVGLTVMEGDTLFRRLCGFYDLHSMLLRLGGKVRRFNSNNVAFRSGLMKENMYDERFERTGGCVQLAERLLKRGARMRFNARQAVVHRYYGFHRHTWIQAFCNGYDIFHTRELDPTMPLAQITRLRYLAPPILSGIFMTADIVNMAQNWNTLSIQWYEFPVFMLFSAAVRLLEVVGMYWTLIHPRSLSEFVKKNFA